MHASVLAAAGEGGAHGLTPDLLFEPGFEMMGRMVGCGGEVLGKMVMGGSSYMLLSGDASELLLWEFYGVGLGSYLVSG